MYIYTHTYTHTHTHTPLLPFWAFMAWSRVNFTFYISIHFRILLAFNISLFLAIFTARNLRKNHHVLIISGFAPQWIPTEYAHIQVLVNCLMHLTFIADLI